MNGVCLAMAWNPRGEHERFRRFYPQFSALYTSVVISTPPNPEPEAAAVLRALPDVRIEARAGWESGRMTALDLAYQSGAAYVHYVDGDRLLRWFELYPDELARTVAAVREADYTVIGRTPAAFATHPLALQQTESIIHTVFAREIGQMLDLCAGSKGLSRAAVEFLLRNGDPRRGLGSDAEWVVLLYRGGFSIQSLLVDGLDWETADRYRDTAADAETQHRMAAEYDADPQNWAFRVSVAQEIIDAGLAALTRPLNEEQTG